MVDTNILIYFFDGDPRAKKILEGKQLFVSIISEIELLGFRGLDETSRKRIEAFLNDCFLVELTPSIRKKTIEIRQSVQVKTLAQSLLLLQ